MTSSVPDGTRSISINAGLPDFRIAGGVEDRINRCRKSIGSKIYGIWKATYQCFADIPPLDCEVFWVLRKAGKQLKHFCVKPRCGASDLASKPCDGRIELSLIRRLDDVFHRPCFFFMSAMNSKASIASSGFFLCSASRRSSSSIFACARNCPATIGDNVSSASSTLSSNSSARLRRCCGAHQSPALHSMSWSRRCSTRPPSSPCWSC